MIRGGSRPAFAPTRRAFLATALSAALAGPASARPLWPGAKFSDADRQRAIRRGLRFIDASAKKRKNFEDYGDDYLWCFHSLGATAADPWLKQNALRMGREKAAVWRRRNRRIPKDADADDVAALVSGSLSADRLGVPDPAMKAALVAAVPRFTPVQYLKFDPATGVVPDDVTEPCECEDENATTCPECEDGPTPLSRYELLTDALTTTYSGDHFGVRLGASLADVTALLPRQRPYRGPQGNEDDEFTDLAYTITHAVYALNDYGRYRLRPEWLPAEFAFLKTHLEWTIAQNDPETTGEFVDTLKSFGLTQDDPLIRTGMEFLMRTQHADGSWGDRTDKKDAYTPYHSTWTAINGLMDYAFVGEGVSFPEALRRAQG